MLQRRVVPLTLVVTALLAVVALAAHGRPLGQRAGHGNGLPLSFWDYVYTSLLIVAVPLLLGVLLASFLLRTNERGARPSFLRRLLTSLILVAVLAVLEWFLLHKLHHLHLRPHEGAQTPNRVGKPKQLNGRHPAPGARTLRFQWDELAIVLGLVLLCVATAIVVARRSKPKPKAPLELAPEALAAALDESLDDLRADPDLRRAIVAAYARMEAALAAAGLPRRAAEAPLEYLERALLALDASAEAVRRLTDLFEWARFSQHEPEPSMRDDAVDALIAVRDELRASELTPA